MDYRKIIRSKNLRFAILKALNFVPDKQMLKIQYKIQTGRWPNFNHPQRFTEKIQLYKIYYRDDTMHQCVDKYMVRDYVKRKLVGENDVLNELYGVYNRGEDIDFSSLPNSFVIKSTDGGGGGQVLICKDKQTLDREKVIETCNSWLEINNKKGFSAGREWAYVGNKSRIIVEEYLQNTSEWTNGLADYKILCFNGKPEVIILDIDRYTGHKRNFYDLQWNNLHIGSDAADITQDIPKPQNLDQLISIASKLSEDFPFVRVDLYNVNNKIYFGELTFYPWSGYVEWKPDSFDFTLGKYFTLY